MEIWIRPSGNPGTSRPTGSESGKDSELDGELGTLSASDVSAFENIVLFVLGFFDHQKNLRLFYTNIGPQCLDCCHCPNLSLIS